VTHVAGLVSGEARKVVTVLFSDVAGSTVLGQELDPESLRRLLLRYFQEMRAIVQRHGGTTEKFIGDAVMAVFGVPKLHEDDALRAVRCAVEMRTGLHRLNDEFERMWGVRILVRMGVSTGEVIAGDPARGESFVMGEAVNLAARLEQVAEPGQILIGDATYRLVWNAAAVDPLPPLSVKGMSEPVLAWSLLRVEQHAPGWTRRLDSPLVGRDLELRVLEEMFQRSVGSRRGQLVTVLGPPGVGKSRLTNEFLSRLASGPQVISGRCLSYGDGITFWPMVEVLREAAGVSGTDSAEAARSKMLRLLEPGADAQLIGERLAALLGLSDVTPAIQETFWAVRRFFEELAARRPLVVVFDDIHWGEPTFLDLLEYLVDWIDGIPMMLVCLSRGDLLEVRPAWMAGKRNASSVMLHPLSQPETHGLIGNLLGSTQPPDEALTQLADVAEGNPLFVEETLRMLVDDGQLVRENGGWAITGDLSALDIPPTIHALLSARLDRLDQEERAVIERAAIVGRQFWSGAVTELSPEPLHTRVGSYLQSLARKELIRPDRSDLSEDDTFQFTHILIRDAAYRGMPKANRAHLHERFADWIPEQTRDRAGEFEEIMGFHLEQAHRIRTELGPANEQTEALGRRAARPLASAGQRAFARGDMPAALKLLSRAAALLPVGDPLLPQVLPDLALALLETGDLEGLQAVVRQTSQAAAASADPAFEAQASLLGLWMRVFTDPEGWAEEAFGEANRAIATFQEQGDERGLSRGWALLGLVYLFGCQFATSQGAWEKAAAYARMAGKEREELEYLSWVPLCIWGGPTPVADGIRQCQEVLERAAGDRKAMSTALFIQGKLEAMRGRVKEARALVSRARGILQEVALTVWLAGPLTQMGGWVEVLAGDPAKAEPDLQWGVRTLQDIGELSWFSTVAGILAEAVYVQGRYDEVESYLRLCEEVAGSEDAYSQSLLRSVRAKLLARRGEAAAAEELGRQAVAVVEPTDFLFGRCFALLSLGETLQLVDRLQEARAVLQDAVDLCERKGFTVGADRARALLAEPARPSAPLPPPQGARTAGLPPSPRTPGREPHPGA
jgi:class 3 adenylate cyclase/tetratricopeptide (TPR) repeat protein